MAADRSTAEAALSVTKFALLASGLVPALIVLAIRLYPHHHAASMALIVPSILLIAVLARAMRARDATNAKPILILTVEDDTNQVPSYVITYVFPFLFLSMDTTADLVACIAFALFALILVYRTDLALVNPLLLVVGYHMFRATTAAEKLILVSKVRPLPGQTATAVRIADRTYQLKTVTG